MVCVVVILPKHPQHVDMSAINSTAVHVTWASSNNTDYYHVMCDACGLNVSTNETSYVIVGLRPGTYYTVSVAACASLCSDYVNGTNNTGTSVCLL